MGTRVISSPLLMQGTDLNYIFLRQQQQPTPDSPKYHSADVIEASSQESSSEASGVFLEAGDYSATSFGKG